MRYGVMTLNLIAGVLMVMAVITILGPDRASPPRGAMFDGLWLAFHVGPLVALAVLAWFSRRFGLTRLPFVLLPITLIVAVPGVLVAESDAATPPNHSPGHGMLTFIVVCAQYVLVGITWIAALGAWIVKRFEGPRERGE